MEYQTILYAKEGHIAKITLNRPENLNAYTHLLLEEMLHAINEVRQDDDIRVLVVTGAGRAFCSGADLSQAFEGFGHSRPLASVMEMREGFHQMLISLRRLDKPTIAAINGSAVAGGLSLALVCDFRVASDKARIGEGSLRFGFVPDEGGAYLLPRIVGLEKALELILMREILDAGEAERIGLVGKVVPHEELETFTHAMALKIAEGPPVASRLAKRAVYKQQDMDFVNALEDIALAAQIVNEMEDVQEGVTAFFEKRKPVFKGK
ncbi:MAG: enoyl-CoA hydratase/isomerase family protein [Deltaproteobacteria bacterium]|nr:enoyl-CoA hydratase/isomerase family protein [Deltaproteobacteria bacterium]